MRSLTIAFLLGLGLQPLAARGEAREPGPRSAEPAPAPDLSPTPPSDLDLLLGAPEPPAARDAELERKVRERRTLLDVHQAVGLATWGLMATTVVVGQLNYRDLYGGGATQKYRDAHIALAGATTASYAFAGVLALAAPEPYPKRLRLDTATVHKASMALTTLGLLGQIALGYVTRNPPEGTDPRRLAQAHQALGYATFGTMTIGAVTLLF
jgi:cytochrome b561